MQSYVEHFAELPKDKLVYLTADSDSELQEVSVGLQRCAQQV